MERSKHGEGQALALRDYSILRVARDRLCRFMRAWKARLPATIEAWRGIGFVISCALGKRAYRQRSKHGAGQALPLHARLESAPTGNARSMARDRPSPGRRGLKPRQHGCILRVARDRVCHFMRAWKARLPGTLEAWRGTGPRPVGAV